jgi:hypothetical protein
MKTLITSLQKEMDVGDFSGRARRACNNGGNDSFAKLPFKIPSYNGKYDPAAYLDWELEVEQHFPCHDIPASAQVKTAISAFTALALFWWHHEYNQKNPTTWAELKAAMRRRFVPSYYARKAEREMQGRRSTTNTNNLAGHSSSPSSASVFLAPSTFTPTSHERAESKVIPHQDAHHQQADIDDMKENEELKSSCANFEPSLHNAPNTPTENIGNVHGATLTEGENCVNVLQFSTNHAFVEQLIVEPSLDLSLSHGDLFDASCVKDELCATTSVLHASAENKLVVHVASQSDEVHLLSSLHTLGYIEFDDLCNLDFLEERIFAHADLPWLSRHSYRVIGKYNNKGKYMVHRIYICTNLNSPFVVQDCDRLEGNHHTTTFSCSSRSFLLHKPLISKKESYRCFRPATYQGEYPR